jgi:adenine-specific DNA-methyltransferase
MARRARQRREAAAADVESYQHDEAKRINIPTAENQKLVHDDGKAIKKLRWPRDADLDPQLVWRGKDFESDPLEVDAPPIYIQEKIKPQAIIEDLRRQAKERQKDGAPQFDFFHDFNGLPEGWKEDATQSYYHDEGNWQNRMILGDSLLVMASLAEREGLRGKVQCIYMDPPYGIRFNSNWQPSTKSREVKDSINSLSREPEVVRAFRDTWLDGLHSYLSYLRDRITAAHELLSDSGSIFVQIGDQNVHRVRALMDEIFGPKNFVAQINFKTADPLGQKGLPKAYDYIVWYAKNEPTMKFRQVVRTKDFSNDIEYRYFHLVPGPQGIRQIGSSDSDQQKMTLFRRRGAWSAGYTESCTFDFNLEGRSARTESGKSWATTRDGIERLKKADRLFWIRSNVYYKRFALDYDVVQFDNNWDDKPGAGGEIYVVQTASKFVQRCILMCTDPGDLVLDPTCGSGTSAFVAEQWGRRWITIDTSRVALTLARSRLMGAKFDYYLLKDSQAGAAKEGEITGRPPVDGPFSINVRHGFVYERAPHVTLKSIANNAEIDVIWERWQETLEPLREELNKALKQNWEEWQIPPDAGDPWPAEASRIFYDLCTAIRKKLDPATLLEQLNKQLGRRLRVDQLPEKPVEPWPDAPTRTHAQWWEARRARQKEIDDSIARNAEVEYLYDRPYKARGVVRVAGPFTVESLSPHRVLPIGEDPYLQELRAVEGEELSPTLSLHRSGSGNQANAAPTSRLHTRWIPV